MILSSRLRARTRRAALLLVAAPALVWLAAPAVSAHPLGNFTVNRYDGLTLRTGGIDDLAVVDTAEIPTLQAKPAMDTDHDGTLSAAEAAAHARIACATLAGGVRATTLPGPGSSRRPETLHFRVAGASFRLIRGQAGLDTGRLECQLAAPADTGTGDVVELSSGVDNTHIGWHEITARGDGVRIGSADVPARSVSDELRRYPADLLSDPLDQRRTRVVLGAGPGAVAATTPGTGWTGTWYAALDRHLSALTDSRRLTLPVGILAVLMAIVLGAGHAALPGHGKTIMAAYLAGRQGRPRDAVTVAGTVTLTHTASVLVLGVALSASSALLGEDALAWLGTISGVIITAAGLWLLPAALRTLRSGQTAGHTHHHYDDHGHHGHGHHHDHNEAPVHMAPPHPLAPEASLAAAGSGPSASGTLLAADTAPVHHHDHEDDDPHGHGHHGAEHTHSHGLVGHHHHEQHGAGRRRGGLIGIGVAGGLVPSPSALVVLLGSIALGRTAFGVALVICYGLGMAGTLAAAGLLLLKLRDRIPSLGATGWRGLAGWGTRVTPLGAALLVLAVGVGTALRAMPL
ncbi:nickel transporter [Streptomyces sp. NBC_01190]|uniref:HoxN/HupN/NixA family nickel/cobalt transporter n=1 Tax=Streptomyces sp. NBC_01190 TaxID=2903767 RepID=UPI00386CF3FB|nr:nickel transporter [Streptomyces sp. NBC_01190]